jgi:hypothetical protein
MASARKSLKPFRQRLAVSAMTLDNRNIIELCNMLA